MMEDSAEAFLLEGCVGEGSRTSLGVALREGDRVTSLRLVEHGGGGEALLVVAGRGWEAVTSLRVAEHGSGGVTSLLVARRGPDGLTSPLVSSRDLMATFL